MLVVGCCALPHRAEKLQGGADQKATDNLLLGRWTFEFANLAFRPRQTYDWRLTSPLVNAGGIQVLDERCRVSQQRRR